jgi:competence protein ComEA
MRRSADQQQFDDLARRRLDALIAELGGDRPDMGGSAEQPDEVSTSRWREEPPRGRHAHRPLPAGARVGGWLADRLPETLRGRVHLGPAHLAVVALLLACGVLWAAWTTTRTAGGPVATAQPVVVPPPSASSTDALVPAAPAPGAGSPAPEGATSSAAAGAAAELVVDVQGTVRRPGIVVLPTGSRVMDAVEAAGGYTGRRARLAAVNLARPLVDGEQVVVGRPGPVQAPVAGQPPTAPGGASSGQLVSLNTADQAALETLPGVGPVTAGAILQWREEHGAFTAVEQLLDVSGIGEKTLAQIAPFVTL